MRDIFNVLSNVFTHDKMLHFFIGSIISFFALHFFNPQVAFIIVLVVAILKEVYDYKKTGFSFLDIVFTIMPCIMHLGILNQ